MTKIETSKDYVAKKEILGICPVGTKLKVWTKPNTDPTEMMTGAVNPEMVGFNLPSGGGCFFLPEDVEEAKKSLA